MSGSRLIELPPGSMVVLIGPSGSGKSTFAERHFPRTKVLSSDEMRALVADDPNDQSATEAAFELLHTALALRLAHRRTTVIDATNVERWARERLLAVARRNGRPSVAIVLDLPMEVCLERNQLRRDPRPPGAIRRQYRAAQRAKDHLASEGYAAIHLLASQDEVNEVEVVAGR